MKAKISVLMITKNAGETIKDALDSVAGWAGEIVVADDKSQDETVAIAKKYTDKVFIHQENNLGKQRKYALEKCGFEWVLVLDSDEIVSDSLKSEIDNFMPTARHAGYLIPFQTHYLGRKLKYGGESYKKMVLFKKSKVVIDPALVNEKFVVSSGNVGTLKGKIFHYSYRSLGQVYKKFTDYAIRDAADRIRRNEKTSLKKIFFYPPHMFWARFIKDRGFKDGFFRIPLDLGFAYMEFLTYFLMIFKKK